MNTFKLLWTALAQLAASVANLADTINGIDGQLRQRAGLDEKKSLAEANGKASEAVCQLCGDPVRTEEGTVHNLCAEQEYAQSQSAPMPAARKRKATS